MVVLLGACRVCLCRHQARHVLVELEDTALQNGEDKPPRGCLSGPPDGD
jgi:cell division protein FtsL